MNQIKVLSISTGVAVLASGCMGYRHSREFSADTHKESTTLVTLFKKGEAAMVSSETIDSTNGYSRTVGVQGFKATGDSQSISAAVEAAKAAK